jgi:hypothetical protein
MNQRTTDAPASWGYNVGGFERHYSGWRIGSRDGVHFTAQRLLDGRPRGPGLRARTLDELAALIEAQR